MVNNFKLIGIRPHKDCGEKFLKVLEPGRLYQFYNEYEFYTKDGKFDGVNGEITHYEFKKSVPEDLYKVGGLNVNISAVVGKNGSGKSALLDLIFLCSFLIAEKFNLLELFKSLDFEKNKEQIVSEALFLNGNELLNLKNVFFFEMYYEIDGIVYRLINKEIEEISIQVFNIKNKCWQDVLESKTNRERFLENYFYTIANNYSIYGFNELISSWIGHLFHKNDGYKTPTVINPYRTNGVININTENHLSQVRTLTNLAESDEQYPILVNDKMIGSVEFVLDLVENNSVMNRNKVHFEFSAVFKNQQDFIKYDLIDFYNKMSNVMCGLTITNPIELKTLREELENDLKVKSKDKYNNESYVELTTTKLKYELIKYSVRKLYKICAQHYDDFSDFVSQDNSTSPIYIRDLDSLLERLERDKSHVSLKLRQSLYMCYSNFFHDSKWEQTEYYKDPVNKHSYFCFISWKALKQKIKNMERQYGKRLDERMEIIPAAFVRPKIYIQNLESKDESNMLALSSGELQLTNSIQTIIYHVYNLNSVHKVKQVKHKIKYKYVNIVLDEVELYFHPEFQRNFIKELILALSRTKTNNIKGFNIIFSTHSPFILSDIPSTNILRLENGKPSFESFGETFGANIHDLLANEFFLDDGFIGAFAKHKIQNVIDNLQMDEDFIPHTKMEKEEILSVIDIIGEPFLRDKLLDMYHRKFNEEDFYDKQIEKMRLKIVEFEKRKNQQK